MSSLGPILAMCVALASAACAPSSPPTSEAASSRAQAAPRAVRTTLASEQRWPRTLRASGSLNAFEEATLSVKVPGRLESLLVDVGSRVERGATIARLDPRDYELRVAQAEAALQAARALLGLDGPDGADGGDAIDPEATAVVREARAELDNAKREHARLPDLVGAGVAAQSTLDTARAELEAAQSRLQEALELVQNRRALLSQARVEVAQARQQLADTQIVAPFAGAVVERLVGTGDYLVAGTPVARLVRFDPLRLRLYVPERDAHAVRQGQLARAWLEGREQPIEGALTRTSPVLDAQSRMLAVEAEIGNPDGALRAGSFARAEIVLDSDASTLVVPREARVSFAGIDRVVVIVDGVAHERRVTIGRVDEQRVEVLEGLAVGDEVVIAPGNLQSGAAVTAARE